MKNWLIIFVSLSFLLSACNRKSQNAGEIGAHIQIKNDVSEFKVPVKIAVLDRGDIQKKITIYGKLTPKRETKLSGQFSGRILKLNLSEGDRVAEGETIAFVQSPQAEALQSAEPNNDNEGNGEIVPYQIRAPFSGIVSEKYHYSGDVISKGETILTIQDDSIYYLWGRLPAVYLPDVKIGERLKVTFPDLKGKTFACKIDAINGVVDERTQTAQIRSSLPNPRRLLKSELFAKIDIALRSLTNVLIVPNSAVLKNSEGFYVFLKKDGKALRRTFQLGIENADEAQVKSGLNVGDTIIVLGNYELKDGMNVEVMQ
ncbi:MAG: efflux RND transporter periplasmic adaptor subunit [Chlorobi bacterium]|nr:efflux RND transporter periplasmic adaptor subunit [Chlorobiota bacterium]